MFHVKHFDMGAIRGNYNISTAGRLQIDGRVTNFAYDNFTHLDINLQGYSSQELSIGQLFNGIINVEQTCQALNVNEYKDFGLPSGYKIRITKTASDRYSSGLYDSNNVYVSGTELLGFFANTYMTYQKYEKTDHSATYVGKAVFNTQTNKMTVYRPLEEEQPAFDFDWITTDDPYGIAEPIEEGEGGYGDFDYSSDDDTFPDLPTVSVTAAGFVNLFKLDDTGVADLANYLWSGIFDISTFLKLFSDPMDCILSLGIVPLDPTASSPLYIVVGNHATTVQAPRVLSQFQELDCGSITVDGSKYSNSFMDYSPYSKAELYLPYVGTVALDIDEIMDSTLTIKYHIDLLSGSCVAYVKVSKNYYYKGAQHTHTNVMYQFSGNVLTNVPITSQNFTQVLQAVIGAVATGVAGAGAGAGVAAGSGEAAGAMTAEHAAAAIGATQQMKAPVARSGNCSSACGLLGTQKPKLMLTLPKIAYAEDMNLERGYPTYMRKTLSSMAGTGYTKVELAHLKGIPCTDSERAEILRLLEGGVEL